MEIQKMNDGRNKDRNEYKKKQLFTAIRISLITTIHFLRMRDRVFFVFMIRVRIRGSVKVSNRSLMFGTVCSYQYGSVDP